MALAGYVSGAEEGVVYIRAEYPDSIEIQRAAIRRFNDIFPLKNEKGEEVRFKLYVVKAQGAYICGEETALLNSIEGNRAEVRTRPPFPAQYGLFGKPTAVNNVETLAALPFICQAGGHAFKSIGTEKSSGTKLISLDSHFNQPGLLEVDMGTPLADVVHRLGGGFKEPVKAMHIGGPLGGLVPVSKINDLQISFESFAGQGFLLGHASVICIPQSFPLAQYIEHLFAFTAHESCGKCFPCRLGSTRGKELFQKAQNSNYRIPRELLHDLLETLEKGSLCALGGGLPLPVRNALTYFQDELNDFLI
jgi:NADH-quinone oxidoreductase subunit F